MLLSVFDKSGFNYAVGYGRSAAEEVKKHVSGIVTPVGSACFGGDEIMIKLLVSAVEAAKQGYGLVACRDNRVHALGHFVVGADYCVGQAAA